MTWHDPQPYVDELAPGVHAFIQPDGGWMVNNCGVIADPSGFALLVDTSSTERRTRSLLAEAAAIGADVPRVAVNTHHHPDHTFGNGFLPAETLIFAHDKCREEVIEAGLEATEVITTPEYGDLTLRPAAFTFPDRLTMHLAGFRLELRHAGQPAHTTNDVLVWLPEQGVLFAGDLAFHGGQPFVLEGSVSGFRRAIALMRSLNPTTLVPGHGPVARNEEVGALLTAMDSYLVFVEHVAAAGIADGLTPLQAALRDADNEFSSWAESERFVGNLHRAYAELEHPNGEWSRLPVPSVWPDMVSFNGGPIECHA